ncbi:PIN domain-containing protein [Spirosoma sp. HMF3257]|uniref:PIN domain-containing protein n=1 Tax=Spirosoma telluris TaxID=2183553 RepID=A0A327NQ27_9BACT|nr:PIN domain-containing protein [Spirosoma telluris]RAI77470.1 hypothetical protein HMF3257_30785 [Spirosoma telluris]
MIDTNAVIDYLGNKLPGAGMDFMNSVVDAVPNLSVITKIEVLDFNTPNEHYQLLIGFMNDVRVIDLTESIVEKCIEICKNHKTKLPDALIAATALVHGLTILTRNTKDFQSIAGLGYVNPYEL